MEIVWQWWADATNITDPWLFWPVMAFFAYLWWTFSHGRHSPYQNVEWDRLLDPDYALMVVNPKGVQPRGKVKPHPPRPVAPMRRSSGKRRKRRAR